MFAPRHTRTLLRLAVTAVVLGVLTHTRADPDLFGHIRFGHDILSTRSVHLADPYSFASSKPWINHEWLAESVMYLAYAAAGSSGLIVLKLALLLAMLGAIVSALCAARVPRPAQELLLCIAVLGTFAQTNHVRPQLFSLALFAWLLTALLIARRRRLAQLWILPIMAVWVDLHGGWIVGAGTLAVWAFVGLITDAPAREKWLGVVVASAGIAVTLINPYGWRLWGFLHQTVGFDRMEISDWQPVFALGLIYGVLWAMVAAAALTGMVVGLKSRLFDLQADVIVLVLGAASLRVGRLTAFFALGTIILLGPLLVARILHRPQPSDAHTSPSRLVSAVAATLALVILTGGVVASARNVSCIRLESALFPEPAVAALIARDRLHGRMLDWFDWGEYAIWHFSPAMAISMDGRRETVYSDETIHQHLDFYYAPAKRQAVLNALHPDFIWVPANLDMVRQLASDGWTPLFAGDRSVLLAQQAPSAAVPVAAASTDRCFPGP